MGKTSVQHMQQQKMEKIMKNVPVELRTVFKHARIPKRLKKDMYGDIFTSHISLAKLDWYLAKKKKYST